MSRKLQISVAIFLAMILSGVAAAETITIAPQIAEFGKIIQSRLAMISGLRQALRDIAFAIILMCGYITLVSRLISVWSARLGLSKCEFLIMFIVSQYKWIGGVFIAVVLAVIFSASAKAESHIIVFNPFAPIAEMFSLAWDIILTVLKWGFIGFLAFVALGALLQLFGGEKLRAAVKVHTRGREMKEAREFSRNHSAGLYYLEPFLMTPPEMRFHKQLCEVIAEGFTVHSKVRVEDVIGVRGGRFTKGRMQARNYVKSSHFDFVVTTADGEIVCAIELDDSTHDRPDRQRADEIKNELAAAVGLRLLRFESYRDYSPEVIARAINGD